ncbi:NERD domain-containing protein [Alkalihalophilus marmarensis]|uniref:nuclease-related domain-containing protein n=1 Tax=Alkalihalophilus marmarensis TaxID=521377 RepID=UPI00204239F3|nr:nuclease-related domain-containing protein [Alkalihalophilus marmarensis]MCM3487709.1 NERD domain-containing protein [Alkalihalophilus marmarensis]
MAHLIKLEDYVSRYQSDLHRYPSQFTRMKKERWEFLKTEWERLQQADHTNIEESRDEVLIEKEGSFFSQAVRKMKSWKAKRSQSNMEELDVEEEKEKVDPSLSLEQVKERFLQELFHSQLRWASSSLLEESSLHPRYKRDEVLRFFTQHLPDNFFVMYRPVFYIKKAPIELDIILITPNEVICVALLDGHKHSIFEASSERFWTEYIDQTKKKRISPLLSLSRMSGVIKPILEAEELSIPIRKVVLSPNGLIDGHLTGKKVEFIDQRNKADWHYKLAKNPSPIKHQQLKTAEVLLGYTHTMAFQRMENQET